jgi:hypothetical protein
MLAISLIVADGRKVVDDRRDIQVQKQIDPDIQETYEEPAGGEKARSDSDTSIGLRMQLTRGCDRPATKTRGSG